MKIIKYSFSLCINFSCWTKTRGLHEFHLDTLPSVSLPLCFSACLPVCPLTCMSASLPICLLACSDGCSPPGILKHSSHICIMNHTRGRQRLSRQGSFVGVGGNDGVSGVVKNEFDGLNVCNSGVVWRGVVWRIYIIVMV